MRQRLDDLSSDLVLQQKNVRQVAVEPVGPDMGVVAGIYQLGVDANARRGAPNAAFARPTPVM